jgi:parvulin-like peptidyl-prolyl isomerase
LAAQEPIKPPAKPVVPAPPAPAVPPPPATAVAATVNGQPILELAVYRGLKRVPPAHHAEARTEILDFLIENLLIDQHLQQLGVAIDKKEVDDRLAQFREEIKKSGQTFETILKELNLGEDELRSQIAADLRWEKHINTQANDKVLRELFAASPEMFDGSLVHARHILLTPPDATPQAAEKTKAQLLLAKGQIEQQVTAGLAKLPPGQDNLAREQARARLLDDAFSQAAKEKSACPSKEKGGDVGWFPRAGNMVEPFAKAAFALKPYQVSDAVQTQFGYHLIVVLERRAGKEMKYEDVKDEIKDVYADKLRDGLITRLRQTAKITVNPLPRP